MPKQISEMSDEELELAIDQLRKSAKFASLEASTSVKMKTPRIASETTGGEGGGGLPPSRPKRSKRSSVFDQLGLAADDPNDPEGRGY